jgi:DNA-directed RNA polymerase subunit RPC12/RpoP
MSEETRNACPTCQGKIIIEGVCEVSSEWHGVNNEDFVDDMQCTPDQECPTCKGTGFED